MLRDPWASLEGGFGRVRHEIAHGRVVRLKRGRYGPGEMPRSTEHRIQQRVLDLREEAAAISSQDGDRFWDAVFGRLPESTS